MGCICLFGNIVYFYLSATSWLSLLGIIAIILLSLYYNDLSYCLFLVLLGETQTLGQFNYLSLSLHDGNWDMLMKTHITTKIDIIMNSVTLPCLYDYSAFLLFSQHLSSYSQRKVHILSISSYVSPRTLILFLRVIRRSHLLQFHSEYRSMRRTLYSLP